MTHDFFISIVVPFFNRTELLKKTIQSVLEQSINCWELILVDDGSDEDISGFLREIKDDRIKYLKRDRLPKGAPACRNIGWQNAKSDLILFLDSDDLLAPWCIKERIEFVKNKQGYSLYIFEGLEFDNDEPEYHRLRTLHKTENPILEFLNFQSCWQTSCVVWNKNALTKIGGWDEKVLSWQDGEIHIRYLLNFNNFLWGYDIPDIFIRKHNDDRISNKKDISKTKNLYETYRKIENVLKEHKEYWLCKSFKRNYYNMVFTFVEGMDKQRLVKYKKCVNNEFKMSFFKIKLLFYIKLYLYFNNSKFQYRALYQLRKIGIPNFRKSFWTKRPEMNKVQEQSINKKFTNTPYLQTEIKHLAYLAEINKHE